MQHITYICSQFDKRQLDKGDQCGNETHTLYLPLAFSPIPRVRSSETKITSYLIFTDMKFKYFLKTSMLFQKAKSINSIFSHVLYSKIYIIIIRQIIFGNLGGTI